MKLKSYQSRRVSKDLVSNTSQLTKSFSAITKPFLITAKSWIIYDSHTSTILLSRKAKEQREIASLTKIMTAYTVLKIISRLDIGILKMKVKVSSDTFMINGTSANLVVGDTLTVWDLLHGLLLPSGNDAALCLADYFGYIISEIRLRPPLNFTDPIGTFVSEMNSNAKELKLLNTKYANPHGLKDALNKSTAEDIAKLTSICMQSPLFSEIVKKTSYTCVAKTVTGISKTYTWYNTNKLLNKGFNGVKTGNTITAGACLAASYKDVQYDLVIVALGCKSESHKWHEVMKLKDFITKKKEEPLKLPETRRIGRGRSGMLRYNSKNN